MSYFITENSQHRGLIPRTLKILFALLAGLALAQGVWALPDAQKIGAVTITGDLGKKESVNISGLDGGGDLLLVGADEGDKVRVLRRKGTRSYKTSPSDMISLNAGAEVDIEAVAWGDKYAYVIGSHSRKRKKVESDKTAVENLERLYTTGIEPARETLYRLELDDEGKVQSTKQVTLRNIFANDQLLRPFQVIPSKENGIDIEGLAIDNKERLYIGFRGPVLRGNYVPVMVLEAGAKFKQKSL